MKKLELKQMEGIEGGSWWSCAAAVGATGLFVANLFIVPGEAETAAIAYYATGATLGPTFAGIGVADACS